MSNDPASLFENFDEVEKPTECVVKGQIPSWLNVTLLRNGPGMFQVGDTAYNHWFDGLAYVQRYHIKNGQMFYSAKYVKTENYKRNMASQRIVMSNFGTARYPDPCKNIFSRYFNYLFVDETTDNASVNFLEVGDQVYAVTELPTLTRIDLNTLDTIDQAKISDYVVLNTCTAHQHVDSKGNIYNIGSRFGKNGSYVFTKTENPKNFGGKDIERTTEIGSILFEETFMPSYYHSFGMTENYMILFECPVRINVYKLLRRNFTGSSFRDCFEWNEGKPTNVHILDIKTGKSTTHKYQTEAFFTFHHANAYEQDGCLVVDYCKVENVGTLELLNMDEMRKGAFLPMNGPEEHKPYLHRLVIPLDIPENAKVGASLLRNKKISGHCQAILEANNKILLTDERLCDAPFEFPRYHYELFNTKPYKYCYGATLLHDDASHPGIVKANVQDKTYQIWNREHAGQMCSEPVFVPTPNGKEEDDGIILCPILTMKHGDRPFLLVLNAKDMTEIARCYIEYRIPLGFHAQYFPNRLS